MLFCKVAIIVVLSPSVVLMKDQVESCKVYRLTAAWLGDGEGVEARDPGMLASPVYQQHPWAVAIDEVHCVPKWYGAAVH